MSSDTVQGGNGDASPMRVYIADMASQLAAMAREEGDGVLAKVLDAAAEIAQQAAPTR